MVELPADEHYLRIAFREAERARERGNHAFGALLVDADGEPVLAAQNSVVTDNDVTAHAEMNLLRAASRKFQPEQLKTFTLYASGEPCPMCAGAHGTGFAAGVQGEGLQLFRLELPGRGTEQVHFRVCSYIVVGDH